MGTLAAEFSLADAIFSRVQGRVLAILFGEPDRAFPITEIIQNARSGRGAVQRELEKLTAAGILENVISGRRKLYQADRKCPIFAELHSIVLKTLGMIEPLRKALGPYRSKIKLAFVYGSVAKRRDTAKSDIDVLILADDLAYADVYSALQKAEKVLRRPVNPNIITERDWKRKVAEKSTFVLKILGQPKLFIFGNEDELNRAR
jgi:predicted nucleotidyltransferase